MRPNPQEAVDLVTFTDEILNGQLHCLCSDHIWVWKNFEIILLDTVLFVIYENFRIRNGLKINHVETALF